MGQHDPLDGFVTCAEVQRPRHDLSREMDDLAALLRGTALATDDPLGRRAALRRCPDRGARGEKHVSGVGLLGPC